MHLPVILSANFVIYAFQIHTMKKDLSVSDIRFLFQVVLMQKGLDGGGLEGFFTLRFDSDTENQSYRPHIVAFEARNDARNFSYLLNRFLRMYQMQA